MAPDKAKLLLATTSPLALWAFFRKQVGPIRAAGFIVETLCSPGAKLDEFRAGLNLTAHVVPMERRISPFADVTALYRIWRVMREVRPDIVHAHTPKAGLLCSLGAMLAGVRIRVYTLNGLPLATRRGWRRRLIAAAEWITTAAATDVWSVSPSLRCEAIDEGLAMPDKIHVLGDGGSAGVDLAHYQPSARLLQPEADTQFSGGPEFAGDIDNSGLPHRRDGDELVVLFAGRFVRDKGISELADAWGVVRERFPNARLQMCGEPEPQDPPDPESMRRLRNDSRVQWSDGFERDMRAAYAACDVCVLPTYREGLPTVALECAAMEKPMIASRVTGCVDAVVDGVTGLLVPVHDAVALADAITRLLADPQLRARMGSAGREFVKARFSQERVTSLIVSEYRALLKREQRARGALVRRVIDVVVSAMALITTLPLLLVAAAATGRPFLFRQRRGGLDGGVFTLFKLRTMADGTVTPVGRFLRATSIDELPQLWNVLRGDMSLVGPRPLLAEYLERYNEFEQRRHEVKPGITGWAQIRGRNTLSWSERFEHDVWYVDHRTLALDATIVCKTVAQLFRRRSTEAAAELGLPEFQGTEPRRAS